MSKPLSATIPASYVQLILDLASEHGLHPQKLLTDLGINPDSLKASDARLPALTVSKLFYAVLHTNNYPALGYDMGLRSNLTSHGYLGFGLLSLPDYRQVLEFGIKFFMLRTPFLHLTLVEDGDRAALEVSDKLPLGPMRQPLIEMFLSGLWKMAPQISGNLYNRQEQAEIWFDFDEPDYFDTYRDRLPRAFFNKPCCQLRFPAEVLNREMPTADEATAKLVKEQCEREMGLLGMAEQQDTATRVRQILENSQMDYPQLDAVAEKLHMSTRTIKRKLSQQKTSFLSLLNETRVKDAKKLLANSDLKVVDIASKLGYSNAGNFTRAFSQWAKQTPSAYRKRLQ